ncbi:MAG TPA: hypothetical protein VM689_20610 [Aliidongia sp.]|nr:hypothetical protein [Aliidongia sp.]
MSEVQVTIHSDGAAASATAPPDPKRVIRFTDGRGREVAFRRLTLSRRLHVLGLLGEAGDSDIIQYYAMIACSVVELAGDPIPLPASRLQLDALLDRLEEETLAEIAKRYGEAFNLTNRQGASLKKG